MLFALTLLQPRPSVGGMAVTLLGIYWIGFALAHAVLLRGLPHGVGIVIDVLVGTFLGDTGAYLGGRLFGQPPARAAASRRTRRSRAWSIGMVVRRRSASGSPGATRTGCPARTRSCSASASRSLAPVGDLFESFVKREARRQGLRRLFGAHGGALDRLDAVLFAAVVGYYIWCAYVLR